MKYLLLLPLIFTLTSCNQKDQQFKTTKQGEFYYTGYGKSENRKRVVIIDSGLSKGFLKADYMCKDVATAHLVSEGAKPGDFNPHGDNITSIISKRMNSKKYCITMIGNYIGEHIISGEISKIYGLLLKLSNVYVVNMSYRWPLFDSRSYLNIIKSIRKGITFIAAAGNESRDIGLICNIYPACYAKLLERETQFYDNNSNYYRSKFKVIGAQAGYTNYGEVIDAYLDGDVMGFPPMRGTSQATALYTALMVSE